MVASALDGCLHNPPGCRNAAPGFRITRMQLPTYGHSAYLESGSRLSMTCSRDKMTGNARNRIYPAIIVVLLLIIAAMAYKFIVAGSTEKAGDERVAILLEPSERELMLKEMRAFVESLQLMSYALSQNDMKGVAKAARAMGTARAHDVPLSMIGKLPLEFKTLAFSVHGGTRHHRYGRRNNRLTQAYPWPAFGRLAELRRVSQQLSGKGRHDQVATTRTHHAELGSGDVADCWTTRWRRRDR